MKKNGTGWIFLGFVCTLYVVVGLIDFTYVKNAFSMFVTTLWRVLPILAVVFGFIFLSNIIFKPKKVIKYLGVNAGLKGWIIAIVGGILSSGPIYIWYPLLNDLREKGMKTSFIATFLYNRAVKIPLLPLMIYYFSWGFVLVLTFYMVLFSVINGIVVEKLILIEKF